MIQRIACLFVLISANGCIQQDELLSAGEPSTAAIDEDPVTDTGPAEPPPPPPPNLGKGQTCRADSPIYACGPPLRCMNLGGDGFGKCG